MKVHLALLALIFSTLSGFAQLQMSLEGERTNYLLYEPVNLRLTVTNQSESDMVLGNEGGKQWLSFLLLRSDGTPVHPDRGATVDRVLLKQGQTKAIMVNITPWYAFREPGEYKVRAVIDLPGQEGLMSPMFQFTVARGQKIWSETRSVEGGERIFSLIRFAPYVDHTYLYLRIENEKENTVYCSYPLGEIIAFTAPQTAFDAAGNLHVLHVNGQSSYCYSRVEPNGAMAAQMNYLSTRDNMPRLNHLEDGAVLVAGGVRQQEDAPREKLSEQQAKLNGPTAPAAH